MLLLRFRNATPHLRWSTFRGLADVGALVLVRRAHSAAVDLRRRGAVAVEAVRGRVQLCWRSVHASGEDAGGDVPVTRRRGWSLERRVLRSAWVECWRAARREAAAGRGPPLGRRL